MNESNDDGRATLTWNTPSELYRNWAPAGFDRRHNFTLGFAYQLPLQSTGGYDGLFRTIVNDWQLNGVFAAFSGNPFTVTARSISRRPSNSRTEYCVVPPERASNVRSRSSITSESLLR